MPHGVECNTQAAIPQMNRFGVISFSFPRSSLNLPWQVINRTCPLLSVFLSRIERLYRSDFSLLGVGWSARGESPLYTLSGFSVLHSFTLRASKVCFRGRYKKWPWKNAGGKSERPTATTPPPAAGIAHRPAGGPCGGSLPRHTRGPSRSSGDGSRRSAV